MTRLCIPPLLANTPFVVFLFLLRDEVEEPSEPENPDGFDPVLIDETYNSTNPHEPQEAKESFGLLHGTMIAAAKFFIHRHM